MRALAMLLIWSGVTSSAGAQARVAQLGVEAADNCVDYAALRARLGRGAWQLRAPPVPTAELFLTASVRPVTDGGLAVVLRVDWPDGRSAERTLAAQSCEAARAALVLLVNMTLDGAGSELSQPTAASGSQRPAPVDPSPLTIEQWLVGAQVGVSSAVQPGLAAELGLFAALSLRGVGWVRPRVQLELSHAWRSRVPAVGGTANVVLDGGQIWLCPVGMRMELLGLAADGCGIFELARLRARGYDTYTPRTAIRPWASAGVGLLLRVVPLAPLALQLGASLLAPLWRDELSFAPEIFYTVPAWRWQLKLGVAVSFL